MKTIALMLILLSNPIVTMYLSPTVVGPYCGLGQFLNNTCQTPVCQTCPECTYMDVDKHNNTDCTRCKTYDKEIDHVLSYIPCTRYRRTVITECQEGYELFDNGAWEYECRQCGRNGCKMTTDQSTTALVPSTTPASTSTSTTMTPSTFTDQRRNDVTGGDRPSQQLQGGAIAGIVLGAVLFLVVLVILSVCCWKRHVNIKHVYQVANTQPTHPADIRKSTPDSLVLNGTITVVVDHGEEVTSV